MIRSGRVRTFSLGGMMMVALLVAACGSAADEEDTTDTQPTASSVADQAEDEAADTDGADETTPTDAAAEELFPDVIGATAVLTSDGTWTFSATLSSPYDTPERYADGWRVVGPDGTVYGERPLGHDHQNEQPFTRSQSGIEIPENITEVTVEGRDQVSGWGGATFQVMLER